MARQRYRVAIPDPLQHIADVTLEIDEAAELGDEIVLEMAAWCPGSYLVRDYARFVRELTATSEDGRALEVRKLSKQSWAVARGQARAIEVRYRVYGYELSVRTNHIDETHAFLHGPATWLYLEARRDEAAAVEVSAPAGWTLSTGLEPTDDAGRYRAADLDALLDGPIHAGEIEVRRFEAAGARFELAVWGERAPGPKDLDSLTTDLTAIVEAHAERLGGLPLERYTFILMLSPRAHGGLEHKTSSANLAGSVAFTTESSYTDLLELLSHEFFHIWNGKRIAPAALRPFDYRRENYTRCLWVMEGLTSYYDRLTVLRAGALPVQRYLEKLLEEHARLLGIPGRNLHSLEDSSFDAWIKLYKPDPANLNTTVSYYLKGGLVATCLDLRIRRQSGEERSLDDVLRALWRDFGRGGVGYPEDVRAIFEGAVDLDLSEPFNRWITGREDPDLAGELAHVGLDLTVDTEGEQSRTYLGLEVSEGPLRVRGVLEGSPAAAAGLAPGDQLLAIDRLRVASEAALRRRIGAREPGAAIELALFRRSRLLSVPVTLGPTPPPRYRISARADATDEARRRFSSWLGAEWPAGELTVAAGGKRWL
jgi:predicted metalloprotease with PDZ domain